MTFTQDDIPKQCYKACGKEAVDSGQCVCANRWRDCSEPFKIKPKKNKKINYGRSS